VRRAANATERSLLRPSGFRRAGDQAPVKLSRVEIQAFGCLSDFAEDIASGLHIFHGPNESGKSTLQQAILALLYGFSEGQRAKAASLPRRWATQSSAWPIHHVEMFQRRRR